MFASAADSDFVIDVVEGSKQLTGYTGPGGGRFYPGKTCARAGAMPSNSDFQKAISWASEKDTLNGDGNGHCMPNKSCSRAVIVSFLCRAKAA